MSALRITLEITSVEQANALVAALENFVDCNADRFKEESADFKKARGSGQTVDWRAEREIKQLGRDIEACRALLQTLVLK